MVRGRGYTVEFASRNGETSAPVSIPYDRIPLTAEEREAELASAREQMATGIVAIRLSMMSGFRLNIEITPPPSSPETYPPIAALVAHAAPNGHRCVKRATPTRLDREVWDESDATGHLVARCRLPEHFKLIAVGDNAVYTARSDADQLLFLQRVQITTAPQLPLVRLKAAGMRAGPL